MRALLFGAAVAIGVACLATAAPADVPTSGTGMWVHPALKQLETCRDNANETLGMAACYRRAVMALPENQTWWASYALLALRGDMHRSAREAMNMSIQLWLRNELRPHFEKIQKDTSNMTWVDMLRWVHDDDSKGEGARKAEAIEMGMLLAKHFELNHNPTDAHAIYYGFLLQAGAGHSQLMDFHRRTGNLVAMVTNYDPNSTTSIVHRCAESVLPLIDGFHEHISSLGDDPDFSSWRRMCGEEFDQNQDVSLRDIVRRATKCVKSWGNLTTIMEGEPESLQLSPVNWLNETAMHRLAAMGATTLLDEMLEHLKGKYFQADRFGRGHLHHAAAYGQGETVKMLLERGGDVDLADRGQVLPRHLGCSSPLFREEFESLIQARSTGDPCETYARARMEDDDIDVMDDSGTDGGWNPKKKRPRYLHCDFDVRDASQLTQVDLLVGYVQSNQPVVLRNAFFDMDEKDVSKWKRKAFNRSFGHLHVRDEQWLRGERYAMGPRSNLTTIAEWLATAGNGDKHIAAATIDHEHHPISPIAYDWAPAAFETKKRNDEISFFDPKIAVPTLMLLKEGSQKHHHIHAQAHYHALPYGHEEWWLMPPKYARTLRGPVPEEKEAFALRCELYSGDVLLVPDMWSTSFVSKANGVAMERTFFKKLRSFR